ncbi:hypothetical protein ABNQ39_20915 [Azospirillum sp. A26]|uniref:hypothetical protein n=1 Tax=Azospirillum sp. A26 TaxID=3160607 RepID=UPI00366B9B54
MTDTNLRHWSDLSRTDPKFTKPFSRSGGFKGTDINPTWRMLRMTEAFGPVGIGWGFTKPEFTTMPGAGHEVLVFCTVGAWFVDPTTSTRSEPFYGTGGDMVIGTRYEKPLSDDEAFKKAQTDAEGNALKKLGVSADVFLKQFDDSKYRETVAAEFEGKRREAAGPNDGQKAVAATVRMGIDQCEDTDALTAFWKKHIKEINGLPEALKQELVNHAGDRKRALTPSVAAE